MTNGQYKTAIEKYLKKIRTTVVLRSLKSLSFSNLNTLGWGNSINIDYGYFFSLMANAVKHKLKPAK